MPSAGSNEGLVRTSPLAGSEFPIDQIPRGVSTMNASDIRRDGSVIPQEFLNSRIPSVMVDDLQGNQFQTGIQYRGFEASPVNGLPQGLAIYQNGVRINEAFGDTVQLGISCPATPSKASPSWAPIRYSDKCHRRRHEHPDEGWFQLSGR